MYCTQPNVVVDGTASRPEVAPRVAVVSEWVGGRDSVARVWLPGGTMQCVGWQQPPKLPMDHL